MNRRLRTGLIATGVVAALAAGGAGIAVATGGGDDNGSDKPITGTALDRAKRVALDHTGGGQVTATEVADEEGYYEVEVKKTDGSQVDVHLDRDFHVLADHADGGD
jgi:uncharacterized membrane protein YkoI